MDIEMPLARLVAAIEQRGVRLPFPFTDCEGPQDRFDPAGEDRLTPVVEPLAAPRQIIYAVTASSNGDLSRTAAVDGGAHGCVTLTVQDDVARLTDTGPTDLVRAVVDAVARHGELDTDALFDRPLTVPKDCFASDDYAAVADRLRSARVPGSQVQAWLAAGRPKRSGLLGAVDYAGSAPQHVQRSVSWRVHPGGSLLLVEPPIRGRRREVFEVQALTQRGLTRAAIELLSSLNLQKYTRSGTLSETYH